MQPEYCASESYSILNEEENVAIYFYSVILKS